MYMYISLNLTKINLCILHIDILSLSVILSVTLVISLLIVFIPWYIRTEPLKYFFYLTIRIFSFSILILSILEVRLLFLIFWELLRITSYLLVCWWKRRELANSCALVRLLSSRIRDVCLFLVVFSTNNFQNLIYFIYFLIAISTKSAQLLFFPWLLGAIERPRPVSALLHSSTLVLSRVILSFRLQELGIINIIVFARLIRVILRVCGTAIFTDLKKRVACSTVYNVRLIFIWIYLGEFNILYIHIIIHAIIKSAIFVLLRISSHLLNIQDIRRIVRNSYKQIIILFISLLSFLSVLPLIRVVSFKESRLEIISDLNNHVFLSTFLILISILRFVFIIEYIILIAQKVSNFPKFLTFPSFIHTFILISFLLLVIFISIKIFTPVGNLYFLLSYPLLISVCYIYVIFSYRRSFFIDINYVSLYNEYIIGNLNKIKLILLNIEFYLIIQVLYNTETFLYRSYWYKTKINARITFIALLIVIIFFLYL